MKRDGGLIGRMWKIAHVVGFCVHRGENMGNYMSRKMDGEKPRNSAKRGMRDAGALGGWASIPP